MASVWAIGDVHGEAGKLDSLLAALPRGPEDYTVFLGDYIDRGPDSAGSVRSVLKEYRAAPERTILLWGNHEDMAASRYGFDRPSSFVYDDFDWYRNGGIDAMKSFGYDIPDMFPGPLSPGTRRTLRALSEILASADRTFPRPQRPYLGSCRGAAG